MSAEPVTIPSQPARTPAQDFYALRSEGIGWIEQLAGTLWTDYNAHDPGVTILEQLCYALTDLAYRNGWSINDLLTPAVPSGDLLQPYPHQAFFTAGQILTGHPVTADDYRRLLIDLPGVRNAWVACKHCACDVVYYAWIEHGRQVVGYRPPTSEPGRTSALASRIDVQGLYEVLLDLEDDPVAGDLNQRKIELQAELAGTDGAPLMVGLELRFPETELARPDEWQAWLAERDLVAVTLVSLGAARNYNVLDALALPAERDQYLRAHWNGLLYAGFEVELAGAPTVKFATGPVALHLFGDNATRNAATVALLQRRLQDRSAGGAIARFREQARKTASALACAWQALAARRNLDQDVCRVAVVRIEDVAVCADIELGAGADIELVQARAWFLIERYVNPPVRHYSLQEMMDGQDGGMPVESIFNGPLPHSGFIKQDELAEAGLRTVLRNSDLINLLMEIDGVIAIGSLLLSKYDEEGEQVRGAADPVQNKGVPVFDPDKGSAAWQLYLSPLHQPRLYARRSRFLFHKRGLPFLARADEVADTLLQLQGEAERSKIGNVAMDLPVPSGTWRNLDQYAPVQHEFPETYGIGPAGLSHNATPLRQAQAKQLQAYLMVFEQLLANAGEQLVHAGDLFSLDPALDRTCFARALGPAQIPAYAAVVKPGLDAAALRKMTESLPEFHERRNRCLDHVLARFGEQFDEYALLLTDLSGKLTGQARLIDDKIGFLAALPRISSERGKAFDYTDRPCAPDNVAGIARRVGLLLGYPELAFAWTMAGPGSGQVIGYVLNDTQQRAWLAGTFAVAFSGASDELAQQAAYDACIARLTQADAYTTGADGDQWVLTVSDVEGRAMGAAGFATLAQARGRMDELLAWSSNRRAIVVEHVLLRPKFPGDALFPPCGGDCDDADPYSFRLSIVMPGWTAPFNDNMELRGYADRTILQELPAHLLAKTCWVGNDGVISNPCDPLLGQLAALLERDGVTAGGSRPTPSEACTSALAMMTGFSSVFEAWQAGPGRMLDYLHPAALTEALQVLFAAQPDPADFSVSVGAGFAQVRAMMVVHFGELAQHGWQFERFEHAWRAWVTENARFNWSLERVQARVQAVLTAGLTAELAAGLAGAATSVWTSQVCTCAAVLTTAWGLAFDAWIDANMAAGRQPADFSAFIFGLPELLAPCASLALRPGTMAEVDQLLRKRYASYVVVSYRLRVLLYLLAKLRNIYPGATLHDCDEGSDNNPVRLGSTALGNHQPRRPAPNAPEPPPIPQREPPAPRLPEREPETEPPPPSMPEPDSDPLPPATLAGRQPGRRRKPAQ